MTLEEAEKLAKIVETMEGNGCSCIKDFCRTWNTQFPQFIFKIVEMPFNKYEIVVQI